MQLPCLLEALYLEAATRTLLDHGASLDREGDGGFQVLANAVEYGTPATVRMLLNVTRLSPSRRDLGSGDHLRNLLDIALNYRDLDMIKLLLEEPENVDFSPPNEECQYALSNAVGRRGVEIVKYFLDHGFYANGIRHAPEPSIARNSLTKAQLQRTCSRPSGGLTSGSRSCSPPWPQTSAKPPHLRY